MSEQPASTLAERAKLAARLNDQERSLGIAWPEALQRLQLRTGSLTRTSPFPRHTGHALLSIGLPAQNPQVLDEYADITLKNTLQHHEAPQVVRRIILAFGRRQRKSISRSGPGVS